MAKYLRIYILTVISVSVLVDAKSVPFANNSNHDLESPVTSFERQSDVYRQNPHYESDINNSRGLNEGMGHIQYHRNTHTGFVHNHNKGLSEHLTENMDIDNMRYMASDNQSSSIQGNYENPTDKNAVFMTKAPVEIFDRTTESYKQINSQNYENIGTQMTHSGNITSTVRTENINNNIGAKDILNSQNKGIIKHNDTAVSSYDNINTALGQNTKNGTLSNQSRRTEILNDQNIIIDKNNNKSNTNLGRSTEKPVPTMSNKVYPDLNQPKVTQDNEVTQKTCQEGRKIPSNSPKNQNEEDRWIWGSEGEKTDVTTVSSTVDVGDRAAFGENQCPSGKVRFGNACVDEV